MDAVKLLRLFPVVLVVSQAAAQLVITQAVKSKLVLELEPNPNLIKRVVWKHGDNLVAEWTNNEFFYYGLFEKRTELEPSGRLTILDLTTALEGKYSVEVNDVFQTKYYDVKVYEMLPPPSIRVTPLACGTDPAKNCVLVCELDARFLKDVSYEWELQSDATRISGRELTLSDSTKATNFTCWAKNPVSEAASASVKNPFLPEQTGNGLALGLGLAVAAAAVLAALGVFGYRYYKKTRAAPISTTPSEAVALKDPPNEGNRVEDNKNSASPQGSRGNNAN